MELLTPAMIFCLTLFQGFKHSLLLYYCYNRRSGKKAQPRMRKAKPFSTCVRLQVFHYRKKKYESSLPAFANLWLLLEARLIIFKVNLRLIRNKFTYLSIYLFIYLFINWLINLFMDPYASINSTSQTTFPGLSFLDKFKDPLITKKSYAADRLTQLVEHRAAVREVAGSSLGRTNAQGL